MLKSAKKFYASIMDYFEFSKKKLNLALLGLSDSGKTTLLSHLTNKGGFNNMEQKTYPQECLISGNKINIFFPLGFENARKVQRRELVETADGIVFMIDAANEELFSEVKEELEKIFKDCERRNLPIAIMGNKIDKQNAITYELFIKSLGLDNIAYNVVFKIFMCSASKNVGYLEAFDWICGMLINSK